MEGRFKIRPMLSFSPARPKEGLLRLRARLATKIGNSPFLEVGEATIEEKRGFSNSPRRSKSGSAGLFKRAHAVGFKETYLLNQKTLANSKTNQSSSPLASLGINHPYSAGLRSHSHSVERKPRQPLSKRISIIVREREGTIPTHEELMTTLSKIILGGQRSSEVCLEFFQESSIYGDEENYIQMDSQLLEDCLNHHPQGYIEV